MKNLLPIDELNRLADRVRMSRYKDTVTSQNAFLMTEDEISEEILEFLTMAYLKGIDDVSRDLDVTYTIDSSKMTGAIYKKVAGKTWIDRISEYIKSGDADAIVKVADTEMTRVYADGGEEVAMFIDEQIAEQSKNTNEQNEDSPNGTNGSQGNTPSGVRIYKTWHTMRDDRVRDTHYDLDGTSKPLMDAFYTIDGDSAMKPSGFTLAENNINCRCFLTYKKV